MSDGKLTFDTKVDSGGFQTALGKLGGITKKAVAGIATGIASAGTAFGAFMISATNSAAQLEQNLGGAEAVFGDFADTVKATAADAAKSMGLTQSDYLAMANKMGSLFQGAGFNTQESMNLTSSAMQRAADVASVMGIDTAAAMESIAGAAKGNFTMMDNLGVAMNDTTLNAYAMEKGIGKSTQQMTNQEKVGLAMQMFLEKTAKYEGNFAKESQTMAGALSILSAEFGNFKNSVGTEALAPATEGINILSGALANIGTAFQEGGFSGMASQIGTELGNIVLYIAEQAPKLVDMGVQIIQSLLQGITDNAAIIATAATDILVSLTEGFIMSLPLIIEAAITIISGLATGLAEQLPTLIPMAIDAILTIVDTLIDNIDLLIDAAIAIAVGLAEGLIDAIPRIVERLPEIILAIVDGLVNNLPKLLEAGLQIIVSLAGAIINAVPQLVRRLPEIISAIVNGIRNLLGRVVQIGANIVQGIWDGISGAAKWLWDKISGWVSGIFDGIKSFFGINSPSKLMADEIGKYLPEGMAIGFEATVPKATRDMMKEISGMKAGVSRELSTSFGEGLMAASSANMQQATYNGVIRSAKASYMDNAGSAQGTTGRYTIHIGEFNNYDAEADMPKLARILDTELAKLEQRRVRGMA